MKSFELVVVWETGETDVYGYDTREKAEAVGSGMKMAFGNQIQWHGVRPVL